MTGFFTGLSSALLKAGLMIPYILPAAPYLMLAGAVGLIAFMYAQGSLHKYDLSFVVPLASAVSIATSIVLSTLFLGERFALMNWLGVALIIIGSKGLSGKSGEVHPWLSRERLGRLLGRR